MAVLLFIILNCKEIYNYINIVSYQYTIFYHKTALTSTVYFF